jgi:hypothetical protein
MPPAKQRQEGSRGTPETQDTLIGDWDPYLAAIVQSFRDQTQAAEPGPAPTEPRPDTKSKIVSRRARLLSGRQPE